MQHYGGPTRLVDVTNSLFVAAFFAVEESKTEAAVWAFNRGRLSGAEEPEGPRYPDSKTLAYAEQILAGVAEGKGVELLKPYRLNRRLADQQGAFLMPMSLKESFEGQLAAVLEVSLTCFADVEEKDWDHLLFAHAVQIVIGAEYHSALLRFLSTANVNATTLFGGLEGFARSLRTTFRAYDL